MQQRTANLISFSLWIGVILFLAVSLSGFSQLSVNLWSRTFLQKIVRLDESPLSPAPSSHRMALTWLAQAALNEDQPQQALELLAPETRDLNPFAQRIVGQSYWNLEKYESAIQAWVQAGDYVSLINSAQAIEIDHPEIALAAYQGAQTINPLLGTRPLVTFLRKMPDQSSTAEAVLKQAINAYPTARELATWQSMLAGTLSERGKWQQAEKIYQEILTNNPNDYYAWINLAWLQYETLDDIENAITDINRAITISPNNGFAYFTMGRLMAAENQYDEADQWFQQALDRNPENNNWWFSWTEAAITAQNFPHALDINKTAIVNVPGDLRLYMQQARIYQGLDDYQRAVSAIKKADSIGILSTWQWMQAGKIYEWGGEIQNAINAYRQALKIMPENTQAEKYLELIQAEGGK